MYGSTVTPAPPKPNDARKQSKIGIASFVVGIVAMLIFCTALVLTILFAIPIASQTTLINPLQIYQSSPTVISLGILMIASPLLGIVGTALGIGVLVQKYLKKTLGIIGLVINLMVIFVFCVMFIMGVALQSGNLGL